MTGSADYFDEMRKPDGGVRDAYAGYCQWFDGQDNALLRRKHAEAETNDPLDTTSEKDHRRDKE